MQKLWTRRIGTGLLGATLMYFFDPGRGPQRRSQLNARFVRARNRFQSGLNRTGHDIRNRTTGVRAWWHRRGRKTGDADRMIVERVRAHLGRAVSHPGSIEVAAQNGRVTLSGPVLGVEVARLMRHVYAVHGVQEIENQLEVHEQPGNIPGLQGAGTPRTGGTLRQPEWPPAIRAITGVTGVSMLVAGVLRGGVIGIATAFAGSLLAGRSATNLEFSRLTGIGARRRAIDVHKSIHINAPVSQVFAVWADFENFPVIMRHVRRVQRVEGGPEGMHWRWTVDGPAGTEVEFEVDVIAFETDRFLGWRTERHSVIQHLGRAHFTDNQDGTTTVEIQMSYNPIAGAVGHAVARMFGADPKHQMDDDLARMKIYIETGKPPHDAAAARTPGTQPGAAP